ncbi:hypothetical protein ACFOPX_04185 [Helicobacter baculiformis]|uniref:Uncharacterized protein n=1 Tax=Helicobacter baculiformis TaxID=427351 RepID=A0ABV7ZI67_9HELI|nr:hypothetical protein [Helicobacter baculiformis]
MRALFALLVLLPLYAQPLISDIKNTIHEMAIQQASVHQNISILNDRLSNLVLDIRAHKVQVSSAVRARTLEVFKGSATLFRVLQDYYVHNDALFDYLGGILQGYQSIAKDMQRTPPLHDLMPLMREILKQLQMIVALERQINILLEQ